MIDRILLFPYTLTLAIRDLLYRKGICRSVRAEVPTVCIGNITVGGTGKTPHTEMLLRLLTTSDEWAYRNVAVLSRGYKRTTKGFQVVDRFGSASAFGDEPLQIARKFPQVKVAVDKDRIHGCSELAALGTEAIVLDDAFQYRKLRTDLNILLVDYSRPVFKDKLLPLGGLRDLPLRVRDADLVIVTKCPEFLDGWEREKWAKNLGVETSRLLFSKVNYLPMAPVFPEEGDGRFVYSKRLILVTGIAKAAPLKRSLTGHYEVVKHLSFPDHHCFSRGDIKSILAAMRASPTAVVATTEKDARRLLDAKDVPAELKSRLFEIPIEVAFLTPAEQETFSRTVFAALG